jgi:hypothetical protein
MASQNTKSYTERGTVVAVYHSQSDAQNAVRELKAAGFTEEQIGLVSQNHEGGFEEQMEGNQAGKGAAVGATAGLGAGALWGLGIIAGALPAIGPVIAGGALAAVAASAAGTAAAGGVVGALIGMGLPEDEAEYYHTEFERGRTIVTVKATGSDAQQARTILDTANAYDYDRRDSAFASDPSAMERLDASGNSVTRSDSLNSTHRL